MLSKVEFEPLTRHGLPIISPPSLPLGQFSIVMNELLNVNVIRVKMYIYTIYK